MDSHFQWTKRNVEKLLLLNQKLYSLMKELLNVLKNIETDIDNLISLGKKYYENFIIEGYISYEDDLPGVEKYLSDALYENHKKHGWKIIGPHVSEENLMNDLNWNIGVFNRSELENHHICYMMHSLHDHGFYSLEDMVNMDPEKFFIFEKIHI